VLADGRWCYGARSECGIRRVAVPGVSHDFTSQYPTVFVLQGLWRFMIAQGIDWIDEPTDPVEALLATVTPQDVLDPALWPQLTALVLVAPDGDRLPTRARYQEGRLSGREDGPHTVGLSVRHAGPPQWYTLADCIASKLHTGKPPRVLQVLRFRPRPPQHGLQAIGLAGDPAYHVDPYTDDLIQRLIELRADVRKDLHAAEAAGDHETARRLDAIQQGMKVAANAASYGVPIEVNLTSHRTRQPVTIHHPDGTSYRSLTDRTEEPGRYFHPLIATLTSSGGRLLLATALSLVEDLGGSHVMCDTDGLFIAATPNGGLLECPGGWHSHHSHEAIRCLSWQEVANQIVKPFASLNPYNEASVPGSILKIEDENYDPRTGQQRTIECFSISAKRYALFTRTRDGTPEIVPTRTRRKRSEHGLGHLLKPLPDHPDYITDWWTHLLCTELGSPSEEPRWFADIAAGGLTITTPHELRAWKNHNHDRPYHQQVRPFNFLMTAHPIRLKRRQHGTPRTLVAPLATDPNARRHANWVAKDDRTGRTHKARTTNSSDHIPETVPVLTYGAYFHEYRGRPEHKALGPDGHQCRAWTRGLLRPPVIVAAARLVRIGKESLPTVGDDPDPREAISPEIVYVERVCPVCGEPLTDRQLYHADRCRKKASRIRR
jgi:hypothetical protein